MCSGRDAQQKRFTPTHASSCHCLRRAALAFPHACLIHPFLSTQNKIYENANYGLALAASTTDVMPWVNDNEDMVLPYTKGWYDAYIAWNMNFVASQGSMILFPKLLIPSVLCTDGQQARAAVSSYIP